MNKYLIIAIVAVVFVALGAIAIKTTIKTIKDTAYDKGYNAAKAEQSEAVIKQGQKNEAIQYELRTLDNVALIRRYCHWVHNIPYNECVSSYNFIK